MNDPELEELFQDPAHREVVDLLKTSRPAAPPLDPHFRNYLRAKLMTEARRTLQPRASRPWFRFSLTPKAMAPAMAAVAAGFLVVLGVEVYLNNNQRTPAPVADVHAIQNKTDVATAEPIRIPFSGSFDKAAVEQTVEIEPATSVSTHWEGNTLVIIPNHPLAPNTTYTVRLKPNAVPTPSVNPAASPAATPKPAVAPTPVVVHFTTARAPIPPVVPPSFKSVGVSYGFDNRLADSGTILSAAWTPSDQLLVTRPAGQAGYGSTNSPLAGASPSAIPATDVWLMSTLGTPIRIVAPGGSFPAAAPSGGLFASWRVSSANQANLEIHDLQGVLQGTVATISGMPDRAAVWLGVDRVAYVSQGMLRVVDLQGNSIDVPAVNINHGSMAASPSGQLLAVESVSGPLVIHVNAPTSTVGLRAGATGFAWSARGDLAFVVQQATGTDLFAASGGRDVHLIASSPSGQTWSDLNWAPDGASLLLANRPAGSSGPDVHMLLINADGTAPTAFGPQGSEYSAPQWSPKGDYVAFTRGDEAGGKAFWVATTAPSDSDAAEKQALAEVDKFMLARIQGDSATAQDELTAAGLSAYQSGASYLLSPTGVKFNRYYPVTVQLTGTNKFLVGVRIFMAHSTVETSFFEEQLSLVLQGQRYLIDDVKAAPTMQLGHGPTVVSFEVVETPPEEQVLVHFDADLQPETVTSDTIQVRDANGIAVSARVTFDADNRLVTLAVKLRPGNYRLVVSTGLTDINGVALAQTYDVPLVISR
jgi:Big-like domain-containing protein